MVDKRSKNLEFRIEKYILLLSYFLCLISVPSKAQFYNLPNDYFFNTFSQRQLARLDSEQIHSSIQPYIPFFNKNLASESVLLCINIFMTTNNPYFDNFIIKLNINGLIFFLLNIWKLKWLVYRFKPYFSAITPKDFSEYKDTCCPWLKP
mgnify:CR=1 FL=1